MIVGMLTAIKSFAKDALSQNDDLDTISYDNYRILLQNFHQYYIAVVLSGSVSADQKDLLNAALMEFANEQLHEINFDIIDSQVTQTLSERLKNAFEKFDFNT
jgi:hypothetical protein